MWPPWDSSHWSDRSRKPGWDLQSKVAVCLIAVGTGIVGTLCSVGYWGGFLNW